MFVTWLTFDNTEESLIELGMDVNNLTQKINAHINYFKDEGKTKKIRYIHRVLITNIKPGIRYFYRVGSKYGWSSIFSFVGLKERLEGGFKFAVYGDMGNVNARSLGKIQYLAQQNDFDMVLHIGDFAYDLDTNEGDVGDEFMRKLEPVAAYIPYMTVVGNHENKYNFSHYINRFTMPNANENLFYSFDIGVSHFIVFSTEFYFFFWKYGFKQIVNQWHFLEKDLIKANKNRKKVPWIIVMGHRPMYCSNSDGDDCTRYNSVIRTGLFPFHNFGLEKLFFTYGVDLEIWAHEHSYERLYPVYNRIVYNGTNAPYTNPPAPVHIITGSAGCKENTDKFILHPGPWSAFRSSNYGFGLMQIFNTTHLYFEQVLAEINVIEDSFWLIKTKHGPYTELDYKKLQQFGTYVQ